VLHSLAVATKWEIESLWEPFTNWLVVDPAVAEEPVKFQKWEREQLQLSLVEKHERLDEYIVVVALVAIRSSKHSKWHKP
jgi:hypothetical protein